MSRLRKRILELLTLLINKSIHKVKTNVTSSNSIWVSHEGNVKSFLNLIAQVDEEQRQEVSVSTLKIKESREEKNLECSINYDARSFEFSRGKAKGPLL
jgi:hypothetical protein